MRSSLLLKAGLPLFEPAASALEGCCLAHSLQCGATARATSAGVGQLGINWVCCWSTGGAAGLRAPPALVKKAEQPLEVLTANLASSSVTTTW